ncbi:hypothetical protein [Bradyrhizobium liaoningense]|uniref:hypothetical protein n=1 Tax=Bradyrhizobium liaoningense TaxID=43992 RepID=UPI001BAE2327|nr:hypothetical protein [Bradyrhizobium liaoningense]MBR0823747.1 hypothetical protein [Bradyrhizobium liaoningense]
MKHAALPADLAKFLPSPEVAAELELMPRMAERDMVAAVAGLVDIVADLMTTDAWRQLLRASVRKAVLGGTLPMLQVTKAAETNREIDLALRELVAEQLDVPGDFATTTAWRSYIQRMALRDITPDARGRKDDNVRRDIGVAVLMTITMARWPYLRKNRAGDIVARALSRRHVASIGYKQAVRLFDQYDRIVGRVARLIPA